MQKILSHGCTLKLKLKFPLKKILKNTYKHSIPKGFGGRGDSAYLVGGQSKIKWDIFGKREAGAHHFM